jgi:NDP-sugar pyrophosphorylase family protein
MAQKPEKKMIAVVMAGGLGSRMRPLTYTIPKPLLPIGEKPILEIILGRLKSAGFGKVYVTTNYQSELVKSYFGRGGRFGVELEYTDESEALGTAGALFLLKGKIAEPFLVMNCDVLTKLDLGALYRFHLEKGAAMTVAAACYDVQVPYGVLELDGDSVKAVVEKPRTSHMVLAGMYVLNPEILEMKKPERIDVPELIRILIAGGKKVAFFAVKEPWMDVGKISDYERATNEFKKWEES